MLRARPEIVPPYAASNDFLNWPRRRLHRWEDEVVRGFIAKLQNELAEIAFDHLVPRIDQRGV